MRRSLFNTAGSFWWALLSASSKPTGICTARFENPLSLSLSLSLSLFLSLYVSLCFSLFLCVLSLSLSIYPSLILYLCVLIDTYMNMSVCAYCHDHDHVCLQGVGVLALRPNKFPFGRHILPPVEVLITKLGASCPDAGSNQVLGQTAVIPNERAQIWVCLFQNGWYCPGVRLQIWVCLISIISLYSNGAVQFWAGLELADIKDR